MKHIKIIFLLLISGAVYSQSTLDTLNIIDKYGIASSNYCSRLDVLDIYGGLRGKAGFDSTKVLDKWGTFGVMNCTPPASAFIGYQNHAGELSTHRQSWTTSGQTLPFVTPYPAGSLVLLGCIAGTEIIGTGSIVSTSALVIAGTSRQIHSGAPGNQFGGGTVTLVDPQTVGINGITNINVDVGATLKLGTDWTKKHGWFYSPNGNAQLANNGTVEIRSLSYTDVDQQNGGNASATGITRYIGKPDGTTFYNTCLSPNTYGQTFQNLGLVEIDNCVWRPRSIATAGPGTIRVKDGGTLITMVATASQKVFISGDGGNATDFPKVAFGLETGKNFYSTSNIELEADATIAYQGTTWVAGNGWFPPIISTIDKVLTIGCPSVVGTITSGWGDLAYTPFSAANPNLLGGVKVAYGMLSLDVANAMPNASYLELTGNGTVMCRTAQSIKTIKSTSLTTSISTAGGALTLTNQDPTAPVSSNFTSINPININGGALILNRPAVSATGAFVVGASAKIGSLQATTLSGALTMSGANSTLVVSNANSRINCTAFNTTVGAFKVDIESGMNIPGTYTILSRTSGSSVLPTVGINNSGLSASFAWVGNDLRVTLL